MTSEVVRIIMAIAGSSTVAALIGAVSQRRKLNAQIDHTRADYAAVISGTAVSLLDPMRSQVETLTQQLRDANNEIARLRRIVGRLSDELAGVHNQSYWEERAMNNDPEQYDPERRSREGAPAPEAVFRAEGEPAPATVDDEADDEHEPTADDEDDR